MKDVFESEFANSIFKDKYSMNKQESWSDTCKRVVSSVCGQYLSGDKQEQIYDLMFQRKFIPGGRYLYSAGRPYHQIYNCFAFRADDSREGWADLAYKSSVTLMSGGGIGVEYSAVRGEGNIVKRTGGICTGPISLIGMINDLGRGIINGGNRRSAIWAGLSWKHSDIFKYMIIKNYSDLLLAAKDSIKELPLPFELTNISVTYDTEFWVAIENKQHPLHKHAKDVWKLNCLQAFKTAEPGFSFNFLKDNENLRNACSEYTSEDDSDSCNLGSVWINRINSKEEMAHTVKYATYFLLCGGLYSDSPTEKIAAVRKANNKIGLGIGGVHEWLMSHKYEYCVPQELHKLLNIYEQESDAWAYIGSKELGVSIPKKKRSIAPTGTIGCIAESTTAIEPLFCCSYKRGYFKEGTFVRQYVVDGAVKRLLANGIKIEDIKDSYDIQFKQRVKLQADFQNYVDMSISSTCNLPEWGTESNNESTLDNYSNTLLKYSKRLRGFTCYPNNARQGQPLERCDLKEALENEGKIFEDKIQECKGGVCGM